MSKKTKTAKIVYKPGYLFRLPETAPAPYNGETRFRVVKATKKGVVEATPHAKEKGKPVFTANVSEMIWCPPLTREKYRSNKKAARAVAKELAKLEPTDPIVETGEAGENEPVTDQAEQVTAIVE